VWYNIYTERKKGNKKMRIIKNIEDPTVKFEDLMIGDVFLADYEHICMKIPRVYSDFSGEDIGCLIKGCMNADDLCQHEVNAYDLEDNEFFWIDEDNQVRPLNAYMEVK
jgi:hypothetical protein